MRVFARGGVGLRALPLLQHQLVKAVLIDGQALLGGRLQGELDRESVGVVQGEGNLRGQLAVSGQLGGLFIEQLGARYQSAVESGLLRNRDTPDPVEVGDQFGIRRTHRVAHRGHEIADDRGVDPQQFGRADHPAEQAAQHVAAAVVARADPVADQDRRGAAVVGDYAVSHIVSVVAGVVRASGDRGHGPYHRPQQVGLVDVVNALQDERDPLHAHAGVDVLAGQRP